MSCPEGAALFQGFWTVLLRANHIAGQRVAKQELLAGVGGMGGWNLDVGLTPGMGVRPAVVQDHTGVGG